MLRIVTVAAMQAIDRAAQEQYGLSADELMEQAGRALAQFALAKMGRRPQAQVVVLAGPGKNGGDGLVCARHLRSAEAAVSVVLFTGQGLAPETAAQLRSFQTSGGEVLNAESLNAEDLARRLRSAGLVVDALLGIGLQGAVREPLAAVIRDLNAAQVGVLSADVPSGLDADSGEVLGAAVRADWTLGFGAGQPGLFASSAAAYTGELSIAPLNFPLALLRQPGSLWTWELADARANLPRRPVDANKFTSGQVLVVGGSTHYHGALLLAGAGALRAGAGYVTLAYPAKLDPVVRAHSLEAICEPVPWNLKTGLAHLLKLAASQDSVLLGPGLEPSSVTRGLVRAILTRLRGPKALIVDAGGLAALSGLDRGSWERPQNAPALVLTPHEGEAARLLGVTSEAVRRDRFAAATRLARRYHAVVVLKGMHTLVADPQGEVWVVSQGSRALATAGTGDVLAGALAAFACQLSAPIAAAEAAWVHGWAGRSATPDPQGLGATASGVADQLPAAIARLRTDAPNLREEDQ